MIGISLNRGAASCAQANAAALARYHSVHDPLRNSPRRGQWLPLRQRDAEAVLAAAWKACAPALDRANRVEPRSGHDLRRAGRRRSLVRRRDAASTGVTALRCGGESRAASIRNALAQLSHVANDDWIVVHDAVRPCVDPLSVSLLCSELADDPVGGLLAIPVTGTLKQGADDGRAIRSEASERLWRAQTPQMFRHGVLRGAFARPGAEASPDEAHAVTAMGLQPRLIPGSATNIKITYPEDLTLASAILSAERR